MFVINDNNKRLKGGNMNKHIFEKIYREGLDNNTVSSKDITLDDLIDGKFGSSFMDSRMTLRIKGAPYSWEKIGKDRWHLSPDSSHTINTNDYTSKDVFDDIQGKQLEYITEYDEGI